MATDTYYPHSSDTSAEAAYGWPSTRAAALAGARAVTSQAGDTAGRAYHKMYTTMQVNGGTYAFFMSRTMLSFLTSGLPDDEIIDSVTLRVTRRANINLNPFYIAGTINVMQGTRAAGTAYQASEWNSFTTRLGYNNFPTLDNSYVDITLPTTCIDKTGYSQFTLISENDRLGTYAADGKYDGGEIHSVEASTQAYRPQLIVVHHAAGGVQQETGGTCDIVVDSSGVALLRAAGSGSCAAVVGATGTAAKRVVGAGTCPVVTGATGTSARRAVSGGICPVVTGISGAAGLGRPTGGVCGIVAGASGAVLLRASGSGACPIVAGGSGLARRRASSIGSCPVVTGSSGVACSRSVSGGSVDVVSGSSGLAGVIAAVAGACNIVVGAFGEAELFEFVGTVIVPVLRRASERIGIAFETLAESRPTRPRGEQSATMAPRDEQGGRLRRSDERSGGVRPR